MSDSDFYSKMVHIFADSSGYVQTLAAQAKKLDLAGNIILWMSSRYLFNSESGYTQIVKLAGDPLSVFGTTSIYSGFASPGMVYVVDMLYIITSILYWYYSNTIAIKYTTNNRHAKKLMPERC